MPSWRVPLTVLLVAALWVLPASGTLELTDANFDQHVTGSTHAFIKFYAPWCGHCIKLAPDWDRLSYSVAESGYSSDLLIAKLDATAHPALAARFRVTGYPTLVFLNRGDKDTGKPYAGPRNLDALIKHVNKQAGLNVHAKIPPESATPVEVEPPTAVVEVTDKTFDSVVMDPTKDVLVAFVVKGCGFCKQLKPEYAKLAAAFEREPNVVLAQLDCDKNTATRDRYGVKGFPTLKWFPRADKAGSDYTPKQMPGRSAAELAAWINERSGTHRMADGTLDTGAGRLPELDRVVRGYGRSRSADTVSRELEVAVAAVAEADRAAAARYTAALQKAIQKGTAHLLREHDRLQKVVESKKAAIERLDEMALRRNVYQAFLE